MDLTALTLGLTGMFPYTMNGLLRVEVVPADLALVPMPRTGDRVEVTGFWVRGTGHAMGGYGGYERNEIHLA